VVLGRADPPYGSMWSQTNSRQYLAICIVEMRNPKRNLMSVVFWSRFERGISRIQVGGVSASVSFLSARISLIQMHGRQVCDHKSL
jgi:hypothetical protein